MERACVCHVCLCWCVTLFVRVCVSALHVAVCGVASLLHHVFVIGFVRDVVVLTLRMISCWTCV